MASRKAKQRSSKKRHLEKHGKRTQWAPFWTVLRKFGQGKRVHPSVLTHVRRHWRRRKLKIKPRKIRKDYLG